MTWWAGGWVGLTRARGQSKPCLARALFGPIFWRSPPLHINASSPPPHQPIIPPPPPQPANLSREVAAILNLFPVAHLPKDAMYAQIFNSSEASPDTHWNSKHTNMFFFFSNIPLGGLSCQSFGWHNVSECHTLGWYFFWPGWTRVVKHSISFIVIFSASPSPSPSWNYFSSSASVSCEFLELDKSVVTELNAQKTWLYLIDRLRAAACLLHVLMIYQDWLHFSSFDLAPHALQ